MGFTLEEDLESTLIRLDATVDIASAAELKQFLIDALHRAKPIRLALDAVAEIDVTAVQLLWAAGREAKSSGKVLAAISEFSAPVAARLRGLGFDGFPICSNGN